MTMEQGLHPKLIQANIALFNGDRAEVLRLTQAYRAEHDPRSDNDQAMSMVLWLEAQAQNDHYVRLDGLRTLTAATPTDDKYSRMAQFHLQIEDVYRVRLNPPRKRRRTYWTIGTMIVIIIMIIVGGVLVSGLTNGDDPVNELVVDVESTPLPTPSATPLPDNSQPLTIEDHTSRYPGGILQLTAYELGSERVLDDNSFVRVLPIDGAQFVAFRIIFECRQGICDDPPEAELSLQLENGDMISRRDDVVIAYELPLERIALGRTTSGWVVFEIPLISDVEGLVIMPSDSDDGEQAIISLNLP